MKSKRRISAIAWLTAAAILIFLYPFLFPGGKDRPTRAARQITEARFKAAQLKVALKAYYSEFATAPTGTHAEIIRVLLGANPRKIVFFEPGRKQLNDAGELVDPWEMPYRIDTSDPAKPRIYSFGPNKQDEGETSQSDDIGTSH